MSRQGLSGLLRAGGSPSSTERGHRAPSHHLQALRNQQPTEPTNLRNLNEEQS